MSLIVKAINQADHDFNPVPEGEHAAICTMIADMGLQPSRRDEPQEKICLRWELPNEKVTWIGRNGREYTSPATVSKQYALALWRKSYLRVDLEGWRGRAFTEQELASFNVADFLGKSCLLTITHRTSGDKIYANVTGVAPLPAGMVLPASTSDMVAYDVDDHDPLMFEALPKWLKEAIDHRVRKPKPEPEPKPREPAPAMAEELDDEIPF